MNHLACSLVVLAAALAHTEARAEEPSFGSESVAVTAAPAERKPIWKGMVIAGGVVAGVGALWLGSGIGLYLSDPEDDGLFDGINRAYGEAFMIGGAVISSVSIPFFALGFADPRETKPKLELSVEGVGLALRGSF